MLLQSFNWTRLSLSRCIAFLSRRKQFGPHTGSVSPTLWLMQIEKNLGHESTHSLLRSTQTFWSPAGSVTPTLRSMQTEKNPGMSQLKPCCGRHKLYGHLREVLHRPRGRHKLRKIPVESMHSLFESTQTASIAFFLFLLPCFGLSFSKHSSTLSSIYSLLFLTCL